MLDLSSTQALQSVDPIPFIYWPAFFESRAILGVIYSAHFHGKGQKQKLYQDNSDLHDDSIDDSIDESSAE